MDNPWRQSVPCSPIRNDPSTMSKSKLVKPRLIIHGGAGNIDRRNLLPDTYADYANKLLSINSATSYRLDHGETALDAACYAVSELEDCKLFNAGKGAVFTRDGTIELEASVSSIQWLDI